MIRKSCAPVAVACMKGSAEYPDLAGTVKFYEHRDGALVVVDIRGLPKASETGFFAFHIHEGRDCAGEGFPDTGGHFNPEGKMHPEHAGDLPPLLSNGGKACMQVLTNRFCVREVIGRTVVIHSQPDDFRTQPAGNAGTKIACGVIRSV